MLCKRWLNHITVYWGRYGSTTADFSNLKCRSQVKVPYVLCHRDRKWHRLSSPIAYSMLGKFQWLQLAPYRVFSAVDTIHSVMSLVTNLNYLCPAFSNTFPWVLILTHPVNCSYLWKPHFGHTRTNPRLRTGNLQTLPTCNQIYQVTESSWSSRLQL